MAGFKFNNKHTNDFGLILLEREISPPSKNKIKSSVPLRWYINTTNNVKC